MIPLIRPTLPKLRSIQKKLRAAFKSGMITNSRYVGEFEQRCAKFLGVKNAVAVSSGTSALILSLKCLGVKNEVIIPSFTFSSSGHSLLWLGLTPVFAEVDPETFNINPDLIEKKITSKTTAIVATHVFGNPCQIDKIQKIAKKYHLKVIYDAAHAFGSKYKNKSVAHFGDISIFSFTPTKVLTTGEGGLIVVKDKKLARILRLGRDNGDSFNREEEFLGISARMDEFSAILGIEGLKLLPRSLTKRRKIVNLYKKELAKLPGISFQKTTTGGCSVYKDFAILVDRKKFGISRDNLLKELLRNNIEAKVYFFPPLHKKKVYRKYRKISLPQTDSLSHCIMSLPLYSFMPQDQALKVSSLIKKLHKKNL
ncbi:DegT/DnrJ/EryC1/StrS family aminotransferase [Patescibacteria group bacterium]